MRFFKSFFVIFILSLLSGLVLPWWTVAIIAFIAGFYISPSATIAFFSSFFALFLLWSGYALILDVQNQSILSQKIAQLFSLPHSILLVMMSGLVAGLVAGFAGLTGYFLRKVVMGNNI